MDKSNGEKNWKDFCQNEYETAKYCESQAQILHKLLEESDKLLPFFQRKVIIITPYKKLSRDVYFNMGDKSVSVCLLNQYNKTRDPTKNIYELTLWGQFLSTKLFMDINLIIDELISLSKEYSNC